MTTMTDSEALAVLDLHIAAMAAGKQKVPCSALKFYEESRSKFYAARAHIAKALRDAERYRWIVESNEIPDSVNYAIFMSDKGVADAAIDAAMKDGHA